jgi:4-hydroxy-tetrahydrodipicolinate synthase
MSISERLLLYETVSSICKKLNCPFAVGISATTIADAVTLASRAVEIGCDGIMLGLPPYLRLCQEEIIDYVESVREIVPRSIPILLYNNVMRNSYGATAETLVYLHRNEIIWGVKHASTDFSADCEKIFSLDSSIRLYTGGDLLTKDLMINSTLTSKFYGLTSILGNVFPVALGEMVADFVAYNSGQENGAVSNISIEERQVALKGLGEALLVGCTLPVGVKYALQLKGIPVGESRRPIGHLSDSKKIEIESSLQKFTEFSSRELR